MLTPSAVHNAKPSTKPTKHHDERGLFLLVTPAGGKLWRFKYRRPVTKKENLLALGAFPDVSLKQARERRDEARKLLAEGIDPGEKRKAEQAVAVERAGNTFAAVAGELVTMRAAKLAEGSAIRERRLLDSYLTPYIGARPVAEVTAPELLDALRRVEKRGAVETAHRVRMLAGQVFKYAAATGRVPTNYNPARDLVGALAQPEARNFATVYDPSAGRDDLSRVGDLVRALHGYRGGPVVQAALKLAPLVIVRPGELRSARWSDFDLDAAEWRFLASKTKQPHVVPLSSQAVAILRELQPLTGRGAYVFPSGRGRGRPMSENAVNAALRSMGFDGDTMTGHGFRAMARTVLDEVLGFRPDFIEHQLAHAVRDANGRAYNRTSHLAERRTMMQEWADWLDTLRDPKSNVTPLRRAS